MDRPFLRAVGREIVHDDDRARTSGIEAGDIVVVLAAGNREICPRVSFLETHDLPRIEVKQVLANDPFELGGELQGIRPNVVSVPRSS